MTIQEVDLLCVGAGGAECTEGGAVVAHGGEGHAQGVHESKAVKHHGPCPQGGEGHVDEEEAEDAEYGVLGVSFVGYGDVEDGSRVDRKSVV